MAIALTAIVLWRARPSAVLASVAGARPWWILAAVGLVVIDRTLMAYRSVALLCTLEPHARPSLWQALRVFFVSTFLGTFLPASIGGDAARAYALSQLQVPTAQAVASVLLDRLLGVVSIVMVGAAVCMVLERSRPALNWVQSC